MKEKKFIKRESKNELLKNEFFLWMQKVHSTSMEEKAILFDIYDMISKHSVFLSKDEYVKDGEIRVCFDIHEEPYKKNFAPYLRVVFATCDNELSKVQFKYYKGLSLNLMKDFHIITISYLNNLITIIKKQNRSYGYEQDMSSIYDFRNYVPYLTCKYECEEVIRLKNGKIMTKEVKQYEDIVERTFEHNGTYLTENYNLWNGKQVGFDAISKRQFDKRYKEALKRTRIKKEAKK